ncbi:MAG TPA: UbiA family prenyltransferase [Planctomycetota bacterium]|nr:UbiA family prenyltransferase [Planctomycetota bacterium]
MDTVAPRKRFDLVAYLKLFRFPLVFTAIADSATGYLLARSRPEHAWHFLALAVASAGLYCFGMALNDIADRDRDKAIAPGRVLPSGRLTLRSAVVAAGGCLGVSLGALVLLNETPLPQRFLLWGLVVAGIVVYDMLVKVPPVMGLVRAFNLFLGVSAAMSLSNLWGERSWIFGMVALPSLVYVSALTYVSTLEEGEVDRRKLIAGVLFMMIGILLASLVVRVLSEAIDNSVEGLGAGALSASIKNAADHWHGIPFGAVLGAWVLRRACSAKDKKSIMLLIRDGVGGIIVLDAALLGSFSGLLPALCIAALVIPAAISVAIFKRLA